MGKVTADQVCKAYEAVLGRSAADGDGAAAVNLTQASELAEIGQRSALMLGVEVGMELVRRYGVLALDDANLPGLVPAEHGPAAQVVLAEVAHRNGYHIAWMGRREFEEFLGLGEGELTDRQWMELDDTLMEYDAYTGHMAYIQTTAMSAGWRLVDDGSPDHMVRWVYRPEGWDQPLTAQQRVEQQIGAVRLAQDLADAADEDGMG